MQWFKNFLQADRKVQYFILTALFFGFIIIATTVYCYLRLNVVKEAIIESTEILP